jgi:hypothetical protein
VQETAEKKVTSAIGEVKDLFQKASDAVESAVANVVPGESK